jgi:tRNA-specific 2-thiouridylase
VLGIEIEHVNFAAEYKDRVFAEFLREYRAGRTPESRRAVQRRDQVQGLPRPRGAARRREDRDRATTRGYARRGRLLPVAEGPRRAQGPELLPAPLTQAQLARTLFPVGELEKTEVRRIAAEIGLPNAAKKDSTGICFIGERTVPRVP